MNEKAAEYKLSQMLINMGKKEKDVNKYQIQLID